VFYLVDYQYFMISTACLILLQVSEFHFFFEKKGIKRGKRKKGKKPGAKRGGKNALSTETDAAKEMHYRPKRTRQKKCTIDRNGRGKRNALPG